MDSFIFLLLFGLLVDSSFASTNSIEVQEWLTLNDGWCRLPVETLTNLMTTQRVHGDLALPSDPLECLPLIREPIGRIWLLFDLKFIEGVIDAPEVVTELLQMWRVKAEGLESIQEELEWVLRTSVALQALTPRNRYRPMLEDLVTLQATHLYLSEELRQIVLYPSEPGRIYEYIQHVISNTDIPKLPILTEVFLMLPPPFRSRFEDFFFFYSASFYTQLRLFIDAASDLNIPAVPPLRLFYWLALLREHSLVHYHEQVAVVKDIIRTGYPNIRSALVKIMSNSARLQCIAGDFIEDAEDLRVYLLYNECEDTLVSLLAEYPSTFDDLPQTIDEAWHLVSDSGILVRMHDDSALYTLREEFTFKDGRILGTLIGASICHRIRPPIQLDPSLISLLFTDGPDEYQGYLDRTIHRRERLPGSTLGVSSIHTNAEFERLIQQSVIWLFEAVIKQMANSLDEFLSISLLRSYSEKDLFFELLLPVS